MKYLFYYQFRNKRNSAKSKLNRKKSGWLIHILSDYDFYDCPREYRK